MRVREDARPSEGYKASRGQGRPWDPAAGLLGRALLLTPHLPGRTSVMAIAGTVKITPLVAPVENFTFLHI